MPVVAPFSFIKEPSGAPPPATDLFSLQFNGSSQYVTLPSSSVAPNADFTIEAWVKLATDNGHNVVYSGAADASNYWSFRIGNDAEGICLQYEVAGGGNTYLGGGNAASVFVADGWTHVALTRSSNTWTFYKNGSVLKTTTSSQIGFIGTEDIAVLAPGIYTQVFDGKIDEIRAWAVARTMAEIAANMNAVLDPMSEPDLTGYWRFEDGAGTTATDELSLNDGTLVGSPTWSSDVPF